MLNKSLKDTAVKLKCQLGFCPAANPQVSPLRGEWTGPQTSRNESDWALCVEWASWASHLGLFSEHLDLKARSVSVGALSWQVTDLWPSGFFLLFIHLFIFSETPLVPVLKKKKKKNSIKLPSNDEVTVEEEAAQRRWWFKSSGSGASECGCLWALLLGEHCDPCWGAHPPGTQFFFPRTEGMTVPNS